MKTILGIFLFIAAVAFSGCHGQKNQDEGIPENNNKHEKPTSLSNAEAERRIKDYSLDIDSAANLGELLSAISEGLGVEIVVETKRISPKTPVSLKNSRESFVIQILETITASTRTRYEVRKGKIWFKDAN